MSDLKPYYETKLGKLYHGDCLEIMPELEPVDLVLTDPPYGIGAASKSFTRGGSQTGKSLHPAGLNYTHSEWDKNRPEKQYFITLFEVSKHQIIAGGNYFSDLLNPSPCWIVWDKDNGTNRYADCELFWTSFDTSVRKFVYRWHGMLQENAGQHKEKRYHPTQKPTGLFMQILLKYTKAGWTVLDPFAGSGTTGLACERIHGHEYVLIEREEKYCEIAAKRLEQETAQLKLF